MPNLSAAATLDLWETGDGLAPVERSLALAAAAEPPSNMDELARLPLGPRDARLLALRKALSGSVLEATAPCPACGEQAEFAADAHALLRQADGAVLPGPVETGGFLVEWRSPDSRDVAAAAAARDAAAAERMLLSRCVTVARGPDGEVEATALPAPVRAALSRTMAEADPLAEVLVNVTCPACGTAFIADLDVGEYVWTEVRAPAASAPALSDAPAEVRGAVSASTLDESDPRRTQDVLPPPPLAAEPPVVVAA